MTSESSAMSNFLHHRHYNFSQVSGYIKKLTIFNNQGFQTKTKYKSLIFNTIQTKWDIKAKKQIKKHVL